MLWLLIDNFITGKHKYMIKKKKYKFGGGRVNDDKW